MGNELLANGGGTAYTESNLLEAHRHCSLHRNEVTSSALCGCFYCLATFAPSEITEWIDDCIHGTEGSTAICPRCGIDSVIGSAGGFPITADFLGAMRERWFGQAQKTRP
jgi:hypothetical protein